MSEAETVTLRERVRERLGELIEEKLIVHRDEGYGAFIGGRREFIDAILREFRLQPVAWGRVTEGGEVEGI